MSVFFEWLGANSLAGYIFTLVVSVGLFGILFTYVAAFVQGRSISYWPPRIGPKPKKTLEGEVVDEGTSVIEINRVEERDSPTGLSVMWRSSPPDSEVLLRDAKLSALIVGTSLFRVVHSDMFSYRDWLVKDPQRRLGLLFLNPYSPHAVGRQRRDVHRSSQQSILESIRLAYDEAAKHPQIMPAIYEGPFRYTARAVDIGSNSRSDASWISIVTSSHEQGISTGFQILLTGVSANPSFDYYGMELNNLWMRALANPPGHGVSVIARPDKLRRPHQLDEAIASIGRIASSKDRSIHLFDTDQLHITISSACRTQLEPYGMPLRVDPAISSADLPVHFGQFIADLADKTSAMLCNEFVLKFSRIRVDSRGYINLEPGRAHDTALIRAIDAYLRSVLEQVAEYAAKYPHEKWDALLKDQRQPRYGPKKNGYVPHVTLGMMFDRRQTLPTPLADEEFNIDLGSIVSFPLEEVSIVHYAYRSLLRVVGEFDVKSGVRSKADGDSILRRLGIEF